VSGGRAFLLHVTYGPKPPPRQLIDAVNSVLASFSAEPRAHPLRPAADPAPARVFSPSRLLPTPARVLNQCRLAQARSRFPILCPAGRIANFLGSPDTCLPVVWASPTAGRGSPTAARIGDSIAGGTGPAASSTSRCSGVNLGADTFPRARVGRPSAGGAAW
jgi:hypothetical protein